MIFPHNISLTVQPVKPQEASVSLVPMVRQFFEERARVYRTETTYVTSLVVSDSGGSFAQAETRVSLVMSVEAPSEFFFDQFLKSFLRRTDDMPFRLVQHSYEGL